MSYLWIVASIGMSVYVASEDKMEASEQLEQEGIEKGGCWPEDTE